MKNRDRLLHGVLVSHTHWDRAWYLPFEGYRLHLIALIDNILDILQTQPDFASFTLDGQTIILEDYREVRPERWSDIQKMVELRRLQIGPFFVLPDEFLVSGEALIRNIQRGIRLVKSLGGSCQDGYMPDSFGHIAVMPQILQGFGLRSFIFMRGVSEALFRSAGNEFWWESADGSRVLAVYLRGGYDNLSGWGQPHRFGQFRGFSPDLEMAAEQLQQAVEQLSIHSRTGVILLCNGGDHMPIQAAIPSMIGDLQKRPINQNLSQAERGDHQLPVTLNLVHGSYEKAVSLMIERASDLSVYQGELVGNLHHPVLSGVWSSRMDLKLHNHHIQALLEKYAEPLVAALNQQGIPWVSHLDLAWRHLLLCHPHDDICGCSLDSVHDDNRYHFRQAQTIAESVISEAFQQLALRAGLMNYTDSFQSIIAVFNPHPQALNQLVDIEIVWPRAESNQQSSSGIDRDTSQSEYFELIDPAGKSIPFSITQKADDHFDARYLTYIQGSLWGLSFVANLLPLGIGFYVLRRVADQGIPLLFSHSSPIKNTTKNFIENQTYRIEAELNGSLKIYHKLTGRTWHHGLIFEDQPDKGDLYSFSSDPHIPPQTTGKKQAEEIQSFIEFGRSRLRIQLSLQLVWQPLSTPIQIKTDVILSETNDFIEFITEINNQSKDHRLRVLLPLDKSTEKIHASSHWGNQERFRPITLQPEDYPDRYQKYPGELPYSTQFSQTWLLAKTENNGHVLIAHQGLYEYEWMPGLNVGIPDQDFCALTLLRCVGVISREGGRIRRVQAGPSLPTPDAQCQGSYTFHYAWQFIPENTPLPVVAGQAEPFVFPFKAAQVWLGQYEQAAHLVENYVGYSLLEIENKNIGISAYKINSQGHLIIRLFNRSQQPQSILLPYPFPWRYNSKLQVRLIDLNEDVLLDIHGTDQGIPLSFRPHQLLSLALMMFMNNG
ncbi:MAG: glycoside hydrolase family 38 C-terminal domain-containing protein [Cyanobacteriota bacterium]|nr:glycoside hydrolase family 38 C-terminal domain-containing protein [Cyanobacteriota bacterium]